MLRWCRWRYEVQCVTAPIEGRRRETLHQTRRAAERSPHPDTKLRPAKKPKTEATTIAPRALKLLGVPFYGGASPYRRGSI